MFSYIQNFNAEKINSRWCSKTMQVFPKRYSKGIPSLFLGKLSRLFSILPRSTICQKKYHLALFSLISAEPCLATFSFLLDESAPTTSVANFHEKLEPAILKSDSSALISWGVRGMNDFFFYSHIILNTCTQFEYAWMYSSPWSE